MMNDGNIVSLFVAAAQRQPGHVAFIHGNSAITYGQLLKEVQQAASYYKKRGIKQGNKVLVFVPMRIDLYRIVLALFYLGACPVFIDEWVSVDRLNQCCRVVKCDAIIADTKFLFLFWFIKTLRRIPIKISGGRKMPHNLCAEQTTVQPEDTALITFTTGSTGTPKAANRTHAFLRAQYDALVPYLNNKSDPALVTLPIVVLINLGLGKTTVLPPRGFAVKRPATVCILTAVLKAHSVETIIASPSFLNNLVVNGQNTQSLHVKKIITGGGPVLPALAQMVTKVFPNAERIAVYGSTEAEPISHIRFDELAATTPEHILSSGLPVGKTDPAIKIAIIPYVDTPAAPQTTLSWQQMQLPENSVGEIVVTGPHVLKAYINNEAAQERNKITVGGDIWHRTGDAGRLDKNGNLYFFGLCKEIIVLNGKTYYPLLVSQALMNYLQVKQAALLLLGDKLTVVLESSGPIDNTTLETALEKTRIEGSTVRYVEKIPTDPRHQTKIDYEKLRVQLK